MNPTSECTNLETDRAPHQSPIAPAFALMLGLLRQSEQDAVRGLIYWTAASQRARLEVLALTGQSGLSHFYPRTDHAVSTAWAAVASTIDACNCNS